MQNRAMRLHQDLREGRHIPTETPEKLREAFGQHSLSRTVVLNDINASRPIECQLKMTNVQCDQTPAKLQKMLKKFENSSTKIIAEQSMSSQTPFGSVVEFARRS
jgi:hypothetical protein